MGLGIYIGARISGRGLFGRMPKRDEVFGKIRTAIQDTVSDPLFRRLMAMTEKNGRLTVDLHPAEEGVEFFFNESGWLVCSAKTSSAGPGYHAFLVQLLDKVGTRCHLKWHWQDEENEFQDETGYHEHRDFEELQMEMLQWLHGLAKMLLERDGCLEFSLSLPMNFRVVGDYFAASTLGFWDRLWFEEVAHREVSQLSAHGAAFFPWFEEGHTAEFWLKCGLSLAWVDLPWHPPNSEDEKERYRLALSCFTRAGELNPAISLPRKEMEEIETLLARPEVMAEPAAGRIGFKRRLMGQMLAGQWTIDLPGYFYSELEDEGRTAVFWFGGKTVRFTSFSVGNKDGKPVEAGGLLPAAGKGAASHAEAIEFQKDRRIGRAFLSPPEADRSYWMLQGHTQVDNHLSVTTVCFTEITDKPWAIQTWQSVSLHAE